MLSTMGEKIRNTAIIIYMIGNALTFTKVFNSEFAASQGAHELGSKMMNALLASFLWPFYWIGRALFG